MRLLLLIMMPASAVRVAFVGNSYIHFNDLPSMFSNLSRSAGIDVVHAQVTPPGASIFQLANQHLAVGKQTLAMLQDPQGWDYVVLQDQSETPGGGKVSGLAPGVGQNLSIKALQSFFAPRIANANATAVLYSTWGRHDDNGYGDFLSMTAATTAGYKKYAAALDPTRTTVVTAPCGRAFSLAYFAESDPLASNSRFSRLFHQGQFSCLYHHDHDANVDCTLSEFGKGGHPSLLGTYMIASVFFATIHKQSPIGLSWAPAGLSASDITAVQHFADIAVFGGPTKHFLRTMLNSMLLSMRQ